MNPNDKDRERLADKWLDAALKQYSNADPRTGIEERVLAGLSAAERQSTRDLRWWAALGVVTAGVVVATAIFLAHEHSTAPEHAGWNSVGSVTRKEASTFPARDALIATPLVGSSQKRIWPKRPARLHPARSIPTSAEVEPRLEVFPSPQPLSEQEKMLLRYVRENAEQAKLVARVQAASLKENSPEFANRPN